MRTTSTWLASAACLAACGAPAVRPAAEAVNERAPSDDGPPVAARLGCLEVRADGDADAAIEEAIVALTAERWDLRASPEEIDRAIEAVRLQNGLTETQLVETLRERGLTVAAYRARLESQLARVNVLAAFTPEPDPIGEEALDAAYAEELGEAPDEDPAARRVLRERLRERLERARREEALESTITVLRSWWTEVGTEGEGDDCVVVPPTAPPGSLALVGNEALDDETIRGLFGETPLEVGPAGRLPPEAGQRLAAAYFDEGYLDVRIAPLERDGDGWVLRIWEGERYHLGRVRLLEEDELGERSTPRDAARLLDDLSFATEEGVFARSSVAEGVARLQARVSEARGAGHAVMPETRMEGSTVDLDLVIVARRQR